MMISTSDNVSSSSLPTLSGSPRYVSVRGLKCNYLFIVAVLGIITLLGEVGQIVWMPVWVDYGKLACLNSTYFNLTNTTVSFDSYAVVLVASIFNLIMFTLLWMAFGKYRDTEREFKHRHMFLIGMCNSLNSVLTPFVSSSSRNPPHLQALLLNAYIPFTVVVRLFLVMRAPTLKKFLCVIAVTFALVLCLMPFFIPALAKISSGGNSDSGPTGPGAVLWPLAFMVFAVLPAVFMNVLMEKFLKKEITRSVHVCDVYYMNMWLGAYQLLFALALFWLNIIPQFGEVSSFKEMGNNIECGMRSFLMLDEGPSYTTMFGLLFMVSYVSSYITGTFLIKVAEGSTFWALMMNMVTPLAYMFWLLFEEVPFKWSPHFDKTKWFSVASLAIMVPAVFIYNVGDNEHRIHWRKSRYGLYWPHIYRGTSVEILLPTA